MPEDYNDNLDILDQSFNEHQADHRAHGIESLVTEISNHTEDLSAHGEEMSVYKLNKDGYGVFTEIRWQRPDGTLARKMVLSDGTPPFYTTKIVTYYEENGITVKEIKQYALTYDQDNDLTSEVLQ